jgi:hypothetical protein
VIDARTPRAEAATATFTRLTVSLTAAAAAIPDMDPDELIDLAEALSVLAAVIKTEQHEREWVARNEH